MKKRLVLGLACIATVASVGVVQPVAAAARAPIPHCPRTITNADNGKTIKMVKGSCLTLQLDQDFVWMTPTSDSRAVEVFDTETFAPDQRGACGRPPRPGDDHVDRPPRLRPR